MSRPSGVWHWRLQPCFESNGEHLVMTYGERRQASTAAFNIRKGNVDLPPGGWDARHDQLEDGTWGLYVIFLGDE